MTKGFFVHYYKRNIGDYHKKAGRLSILEHGAYTLLLDACYDRERFPTRQEAIDWCWARTEPEIAAVEFVLSKFFTLIENFYVQPRISDEIETYRKNASTNRRIAKNREDKRKQSVNEACTPEHEPPPNHKPLTTNQEPRTTDQETLAVGDESPPAAAKSKIAKSFFDYETGRIENLSANIVASWQQAYPAIDIRIEIAKAKAWLLANPKNRKSNLEKFLTNWLNKAQDRAPRVNHENGRRPDQREDNSAAGRVRAAVARERSAERANAAAVADDEFDVRPQVDGGIRRGSGPGQGVGSVLEGDFTRTD